MQRKSIYVLITILITVSFLTSCNTETLYSHTSSTSQFTSTTESNAVLLPDTPETSEYNEQNPIIQEAFQIWKSFGGAPNFRNEETMSASMIADLYANHCENTSKTIKLIEDNSGINQWIPSAQIEDFFNKYFAITPDKIRDGTVYYNTSLPGYLYPSLFPPPPNEATITHVQTNKNGSVTMTLEYLFQLPPELYDGIEEAKATHIVTIEINKNSFHFISATISDERDSYK